VWNQHIRSSPAKRERTVQLRAIISKDGAVEHLEVISGSPLLVRAATDAVLQWRFRSTLLNGEPVEVQTYFTVVFHLGQ
jgi:protein TonB